MHSVKKKQFTRCPCHYFILLGSISIRYEILVEIPFMVHCQEFYFMKIHVTDREDRATDAYMYWPWLKVVVKSRKLHVFFWSCRWWPREWPRARSPDHERERRQSLGDTRPRMRVVDSTEDPLKKFIHMMTKNARLKHILNKSLL